MSHATDKAEGSYKMQHVAYCGMTTVTEQGTLQDMRGEVAKLIRKMRSDGYGVTTLEIGKEWEVLEPEDCALVPDDCGVIHIGELTQRCRECGCDVNIDFIETCCAPVEEEDEYCDDCGALLEHCGCYEDDDEEEE